MDEGSAAAATAAAAAAAAGTAAARMPGSPTFPDVVTHTDAHLWILQQEDGSFCCLVLFF